MGAQQVLRSELSKLSNVGNAADPKTIQIPMTREMKAELQTPYRSLSPGGLQRSSETLRKTEEDKEFEEAQRQPCFIHQELIFTRNALIKRKASELHDVIELPSDLFHQASNGAAARLRSLLGEHADAMPSVDDLL